jgi:chromosome segregation ATPase
MMANAAQRKKDRRLKTLVNLGREARPMSEELTATRFRLAETEAAMAACRVEVEQLRSQTGEFSSTNFKLQEEVKQLRSELVFANAKIEVKDDAIDRWVSMLRETEARVAGLEGDLVSLPKLRVRLHQQGDLVRDAIRRSDQQVAVLASSRSTPTEKEQAAAKLAETKNNLQSLLRQIEDHTGSEPAEPTPVAAVE